MSEYIRSNKFDTNECPNIFIKEKLIRMNVRIHIRDQYIRIFEYSNIFVTLWKETHFQTGQTGIVITQKLVLPPGELLSETSSGEFINLTVSH